jgi:hypothetical protein
MEKNRLEAFSDGVLAIIITIMVLEMKVPHGSDFAAVKPLLPVFLTYVLSFIYVGIYWNNHHHLLKACRRVNAGILWANLHLLFWLCTVSVYHRLDRRKPFHGAAFGGLWRRAATGCRGLLYLQTLIVAEQGRDSKLAIHRGDFKGKLSPVLYARYRGFFSPTMAGRLHLCDCHSWVVPDHRLEQVVDKSAHHRTGKRNQGNQ